MKIEKFKEPIFVTHPLLPDLNKVQKKLEEIWATGWLTNHGTQHNTLEGKLSEVMGMPNVSLFNNGTIALMCALRALDIRQGEVITTPFTFPASPHSISWNGLTPVFCDIREDTMCIDENKIESLITKNTKAILGVHVYGLPCNVDAIQKIADKHNLKVIYDAAHAFSTEIDGKSIGAFGDISMFSFHATKLFNSIEGGCLTYKDNNLKEKIYLLRNFGIKNEHEVIDIGLNGKMNEIQAAVGLLNLELFKEEKQKRAEIYKIYKENLGGIKGIVIPKMQDNVTNSYQYFVIKIDKEVFGMSRDDVYSVLKNYNVYSRKYFAPLCSEYSCYKDFSSSSVSNLSVANKIKEQVLCLPFYGALGTENTKHICEIIKSLV